MNKFFKHLFCKHNYGVNRWHITHGPNGNDPASIEVEEICLKCGKIRYRDDSIKRLEAYKTLSNEYERRIWAYPECDHLNIALRFLLKKPEENKPAIEEIYFAISKANGYFYEDVKEKLKEEFRYTF